MNILITGINGFIGSNFAAKLRSQGNATVYGIDIQPRPMGTTACDQYRQLDLGSPEAADILQSLPTFERILHAGGISGLMVETDNPRRIFDVNVAGTMAILEWARRSHCERLVLCSTIMVYGPDTEGSTALDESQYPRPISVYGATKLAQEALMHAFVAQYGLDAIALRFSHVYGPNRTTECFIREMLLSAAQARACAVSQTRSSLRQYIHISDVIESIERAMEVRQPHSRVFNISADEISTLSEAADVVRSVVGALDVVFDESRDLPNYRIPKLSICRARDELSFQPRTNLYDGIQSYYQAIKRAERSPQKHT